MAEDLQSQLLKAGLVDKKQARRSRQEKKRQRKKQGEGGAPAAAPAQAAGRDAEKVRRDRELNRERQAALAARERAAQARQLIEGNRIPRDEGEIPFQFVHADLIKRIYVTESLRQALASGRASIVTLDEHYEIVPADVAQRIEARDPERIVLHQPSPLERESSADDEEYAEHRIPDDLTW